MTEPLAKSVSPRRHRKSQEGQAMVEYILLCSTILAVYSLLVRSLDRFGFADKFYGPVKTEFRFIYRYGNKDTRFYDDGGPKNHARAQEKNTENFRMFINRVK